MLCRVWRLCCPHVYRYLPHGPGLLAPDSTYASAGILTLAGRWYAQPWSDSHAPPLGGGVHAGWVMECLDEGLETAPHMWGDRHQIKAPEMRNFTKGQSGGSKWTRGLANLVGQLHRLTSMQDRSGHGASGLWQRNRVMNGGLGVVGLRSAYGTIMEASRMSFSSSSNPSSHSNGTGSFV
eukprot:2685536-Amphidinium_carterae.1